MKAALERSVEQLSTQLQGDLQMLGCKRIGLENTQLYRHPLTWVLAFAGLGVVAGVLKPKGRKLLELALMFNSGFLWRS